MAKKLFDKKCVERIGVKSMVKEDIDKYLSQLKNQWEVIEEKKINYTFKFKTFKEAISFINKVADLAESENHHPNIHILYNKIKIVLSTHSVGGLSENDFILAAKIEKIV
ncbi:hypothetical protein A2767_04195 [Candidatus Roizmanbacteria bacterium RIFCSPHIGHO2_01_FULL_35_10]|uniref:Putative pterin-4-alpha-carbinolamine dehydratase n=1 Tax=Candidatus Roizmanbacteria bacterium RIFCSPLOWO2_01_FULL_35_13 TaxID=1802055 RepID=A0A1F7IA78_9BACT|nr:MAG: hypothetical protein A2767_04195 [Candidatus Roizmanbacteria bacterium RIFCSPHIGHO2_01_FULL_35_10]OGK40274.1 MAG: hypothetical protein A3A74_07250 [Candidatus Roizmanbacteria bacterium RIFCSPLOWO2_01_FULL_35_13]